MKSKLCVLTFAGLLASSWAGFAQTNAPAGDSQASPAGAADTNAPAPLAPAAADNAAAPTNSPAPAQEEAPAPEPGAVIPLIIMDDVPLTDAIRNLARQARLNYMLDPKIGFGQAGADGKTVAMPTVSIRWENTTAEQALNALLNNYNLQLVEDPKTKIARVSVKDPAAPDPLVTKIIQLKYAAPTNVLASIHSVLTDKRSKAVADVRTSQLVVLATERELAEVDRLVERLDTQTKQVLIEAKLLETAINPHSLKGVNWSGTLKNQHVNFGNNLQDVPVTSGQSVNRPLATEWPRMMFDTAKGFNPATAFLDADGVSAVLSFLNTYAETKVISTPRAVTLDNELATIEVGTMFPIVNINPGTVQTAGGSSVAYSNLTVKLDVTPRISANNYVNLKVAPRILRLGDQVTSTIEGKDNVAWSFSKREISASVMIPSGDTLVMGGLIEDNIHNENSKVPVLGDIPGLGYLFRHDLKDRKKNNLIVFITPTIVQDSDFQPSKSDYLKTPAPKSDTLEPDWSAWDSGQKKDWSKQTASKGSDGGAGQFAPVP